MIIRMWVAGNEWAISAYNHPQILVPSELHSECQAIWSTKWIKHHHQKVPGSDNRPVIPILKRGRQEDQEFKAGLATQWASMGQQGATWDSSSKGQLLWNFILNHSGKSIVLLHVTSFLGITPRLFMLLCSFSLLTRNPFYEYAIFSSHLSTAFSGVTFTWFTSFYYTFCIYALSRVQSWVLAFFTQLNSCMLSLYSNNELSP